MRDWRWREGSSPLRRRRVIIDVNGAPVVGSHHSPTVREFSGNDGGSGGGGDGDGGGAAAKMAASASAMRARQKIGVRKSGELATKLTIRQESKWEEVKGISHHVSLPC